METKNVAVVGHTHLRAMGLIALIEQEKEILNLIPETIGDTSHLESINFRIGQNGKEIRVFPEEKIDIFKKYKNLIVIDFINEKNNIDFYEKNNIKKIIPCINAKIENILELIILL